MIGNRDCCRNEYPVPWVFVPDEIFDNPRLAAIYDDLDPDRSDLDHYAAIVEELGASTVLDVGCGTGTFACLLADRAVEVVGVDPAPASLDVARAKPNADLVRWIVGDATSLPALEVDLAVMTGNVAQVFLADAEWEATLRAIHAALRPGGHLVFETRDPARRGWEAWTRERTFQRVEIAEVGAVEHWVEVIDVDAPFVTFESPRHFLRDGSVVTSRSTLRFRDREEIETSLRRCGFDVSEVRGAPDRPGLEFVFLARRRAV